MRPYAWVGFAALGVGMAVARGVPDTAPVLGDYLMGGLVIGCALLLSRSRDHRHSDGDAGGGEQTDRSLARRAGQVVNRLRRKLT
jgi:hypothetical protein